MNKISIEITPNPDGNDHQLEIKIDGNNAIKGFLGIDPPEFFNQNALIEGGRLIIGRCGCGEVGCGSKIVEVEIKESSVYWTIPREGEYIFDKGEYFGFWESKKNDYSWEDSSRRIERLINNVFNGSKLKGKLYFDWKKYRFKRTSEYSFNWASSRITYIYTETDNSYITLSYSLNEVVGEVYHQELLSIPWYKGNDERTVSEAKIFKSNNRRIK